MALKAALTKSEHGGLSDESYGFLIDFFSQTYLKAIVV